MTATVDINRVHVFEVHVVDSTARVINVRNNGMFRNGHPIKFQTRWQPKMQFMRLSKLHVLKQLASGCRNVGHTMFNKYLLLTNVGISMCLSATGDVIQQHYEMMHNERKNVELIRTRNMSISGVTVGVVCHFTYNYLDKKLPGRSLQTVLKKVVVDQLVFSPIYLTVFFFTLAILEGSNWVTLKKEVTHKAWRLYLAEWLIWPPAQVINFYFLPTKFRVLYDNTISLGFDIYTSYIKHNISIEEEKVALEEK
ncbi:mpv17-like protein 2 isoform X1 [Schistocerca nitens]|uniref:mpv17-like protein 2 isoform X1 n=2 Tax=Schistocerca nitens TaxID=7011 RepID=UPI0021192EFC|nr:mpv17-like protein 2 isoform X1 [Schistocerca nitens]